MENKIAKMIGIMMMSRTYAHMAHLKTNSYSKHMALNDFYDDESDADFDITEMLDDFAETAQGMFGKIDVPFVELKGDIEMPTEGLETHLQMLMNLSKGCEDRALNAIFDEVIKLYRTTIYKLRELD
jgi:hypothetical protein